ncbi:diaminopimelate decarboxylase [Membranihabitans maritimus]|uniref:diaminopimelate decarboxylase n=1 Tax=Membranihabitans maritimus TaxID=2904244 RepID=UPI001F000531|nr:diaminopimelate decarboxylase [Membranihabitans maritimus]
MELINGQYCIQDIPVIELAKKYETPLFVYDANKIEEQYKKMVNAFDVPKLKINYACKALTNINVLKLMKELGAGIDAVSPEEIKLSLHAGFEPEEIVFTPNSVGTDEIEEAIKLGVKINIDNIELLEYFGHHYPDLKICIRINPHVMAGGNRKISVGHIDSKFGISIHQMPLVLRIVESLEIQVEGIHMHTGSDILDVDVFLYAADILFNQARNFPDLEYIDFGSGFKVKYKSDDIETDIVQFGKQMSKKFNAFCKETGKDLTLAFEPGKYLVSESGYFLARTNTIKQTTSTVFAGINSGFNHMIRPMFYNAYHEIINVSNPEGVPKLYTVVGYICETDTFGYNRKINTLTPGDILVFKNAGAYCYMMASNYNSRLLPAEVMIRDGKDYLIRKRQNFTDLLVNQVEVNLPVEQVTAE